MEVALDCMPAACCDDLDLAVVGSTEKPLNVTTLAINEYVTAISVTTASATTTCEVPAATVPPCSCIEAYEALCGHLFEITCGTGDYCDVELGLISAAGAAVLFSYLFIDYSDPALYGGLQNTWLAVWKGFAVITIASYLVFWSFVAGDAKPGCSAC